MTLFNNIQLSPYVSVEGKAIPGETWRGHEGTRRFRLTDFKIFGNEGGKVVSPTHRTRLHPHTPQAIFLVIIGE
jgi:hypothetical protein